MGNPLLSFFSFFSFVLNGVISLKLNSNLKNIPIKKVWGGGGGGSGGYANKTGTCARDS